ncbi:hypothetical protein AB2B41_07795 [Marimonas sp. MJW-29]|uniref:Acetoacetate decarboxylase n=1 Tax=Sulfitobacter sediminis TaxID=3234186 RepID=A0ABV3RKJ4_9RHOB
MAQTHNEATNRQGDAGCGCDPANLVPDLTGTRSVPPFVATGVRMLSFPVAASLFKLTALCDRYLNAPDPASPDWRPLTSMVYVQVLQYDRLVSEPYAQFGFIRQNELLFQIPIISPFKATEPKVGFFSPYLVVDNPVSLTVGREVFGFAKTFGGFQITDSDISVTNWLTPTQDANAQLAEHPLLGQPAYARSTAFLTLDEKPDVTWPYGPIRRLFRKEDGRGTDVGDEEPPFELDEVAWRHLFDSSDMPIVFSEMATETLKQIDSTTVLAPAPEQAAYQARISATSRTTAIAGTGHVVSGPLTVHRYDPLDLVDSFGMQTFLGKVPVWHPYWIDLDFRIDDTTLLTCHC